MNEIAGLNLNIGAGHTHIPGYTNIDVSPKADVSLDLGVDRLPFDDSSVDSVFSYHTLEHVPDYLFALSEIYRVLKHGAPLLVGLPYVTLTEYHLVNPYHLHNFNEHAFDFFNPKKLKGSAAEETSIAFAKVFHRFHYMGGFRMLPPPLKTWCRRHLFNVVRKIDFGLVAIKDPDQAPPAFDAKTMRNDFDRCLQSRIPYRAAE